MLGVQLGGFISLFFKDVPAIAPLLKQLRKPPDKKKLVTHKLNTIKMHVSLRRLALISALNLLSTLPSFCDQSTMTLKKKISHHRKNFMGVAIPSLITDPLVVDSLRDYAKHALAKVHSTSLWILVVLYHLLHVKMTLRFCMIFQNQ